MYRAAHREWVSFRSGREQLKSVLFLPESNQPAPVLIICHGAGEYKENYFELCELLAADGEVARPQLAPVEIDGSGVAPAVDQVQSSQFGTGLAGTSGVPSTLIDAVIESLQQKIAV
jgi:dienelactone hydrolase